MDATSVEECWRLLRQTGKSISYESLANVPRYSAWLAGAGLDRRLRAAPGQPPADRPQRPGPALGAEEPVPPGRPRRADEGLPGRARRLHAPRPGHLDGVGVLAVGRGDGRHLDHVRRRDDRPHPAGDAVPVLADVLRGAGGVRPGAVRGRRLPRVRRRPGRAPPAASTTRSASTGPRPPRPRSRRSTGSRGRAGSARPTVLARRLRADRGRGRARRSPDPRDPDNTALLPSATGLPGRGSYRRRHVRVPDLPPPCPGPGSGGPSGARRWGWHPLTDTWAERIVADADVRAGRPRCWTSARATGALTATAPRARPAG